MLQMIAFMIYGGAALLALTVLVGALTDSREAIVRALLGARQGPAQRARVLGRARRIRSLSLRPAPMAEPRRAAA